MTASPASGPAHPWRDVPYVQLLTGLRRFLRTDGEHYLDDPNVASVGLGCKVTGGRVTPELAVQFTVREKRGEPEALAALGTTPVPEAITVAGIRMPTDVVECRSEPGVAHLPAPAPEGRGSSRQPQLPAEAAS